MRRRGLVIIASVIAGVALGCGEKEEPQMESAVSSLPDHRYPVVDCKSREQTITTRRYSELRLRHLSSSVELGGVTLLAATTFEDSRSFELDGKSDVAKIPIVVRAGSVVVVEVDPRPNRRLNLEVALDERPYQATGKGVELRPCRPAERVGGGPVGPFTAFAGGLASDGPMCVDVTVHEAGAPTLTETIGLGMRCAAHS